MQKGDKQQNTIKTSFIFCKVKHLIRLSLFSWAVFLATFVNNGFIAVPCIKVDNSITLNIFTEVLMCFGFFCLLETHYSNKIQQTFSRTAVISSGNIMFTVNNNRRET